MIVISDTSPITNLMKIGQLGILRQAFQQVIIPIKVYEELVAWENLGADLSEFKKANWITIEKPTNYLLIRELQIDLDKGEAEAIALAKELNADYLLIDERRGWKIAKEMGINAIGVIGVLLDAKKLGILENVMPVIDDLRKVSGFWLNDSFYEQIRTLVKE